MGLTRGFLSECQTLLASGASRLTTQARRPVVQAAAAGAAVLSAAYSLLPRREFALLAGIMAVGAAIGYYPGWRAQPRARPAVDPDLRRAAYVEALAASLYKLVPGLPALAIPEIARGIHSTGSAVDAGIAAISGVGFITISTSIARLMRRIRAARATQTRATQPALTRKHVLLSFLMVSVGLGACALATNAREFIVGLSLTGLPVALNARLRNVVQAEYDRAGAGEFQAITNGVYRTITNVGLPCLGLLITFSPLGWRGAFTLMAAVSAGLGFIVVRIRRLPPPERQAAAVHIPRNARLSWSVQRQIWLTVSTTATAQLARTVLAPLLVDHGVQDTAFWTGAVFFISQVGTRSLAARYARLGETSPREAALRATTLFLPAAAAGLLTAVAPLAWLTLAFTVVWFALNETGNIGSGLAMRTGMNRPGAVISLWGSNAGYAGQTIGSVLAGLALARYPLGLGGMLLAGAVISVIVAARAPNQLVSEHTRTTQGSVITLTFEAFSDGTQVTIADERGRCPPVRIESGDALTATLLIEHNQGSEPTRAGTIWIWRGDAWWAITALGTLERTLAWLVRRPDRIHAWLPAAFAEPRLLHAVASWRLQETAVVRQRARDGFVLRITLPEGAPLQWTHRRRIELSDAYSLGG